MTSNNVQYDIFISYRRSDGFATAQLIYDRLEQRGYRVSFDMETLRSGNFNTQLYERIEKCQDVVVIISKDALNFRENPEDDWLRLEIAHALKHKKNIIPVFLRDVNIPKKEELPEDIAEIVMKNGVTASEEHFDSTIQKLCRLMHAKRWGFVKKLIAAMAVLLFCAAAAAGYFLLHDAGADVKEKQETAESAPRKIYPSTNEEKQEFSQIFTYLVFQISNVNTTSHFFDEFMKEAVVAATLDDPEALLAAKQRFDHNFKNTPKFQFQDSFVTMAQKSNAIDAGDLQVFPQLYDGYMQFVASSADKIVHFISPASMIPKKDQLRLIECNRQWEKQLAENMGLTFIALLYKVESPDLEKFKKMNSAQLTYLPILSNNWPETEDEIINQINRSNEKLELLLQEETAIAGNLSRDAEAAKKQLREKMKQQGYTDEQIERIMTKIDSVSRKKTELVEMEARFKETQRKVREKFAPALSDDDGILWGKMVAFQKSYLPEDALQGLEMIGKNQDKHIPEKVCQVAKKILQTPQDLPFFNGVIVCFFEPPATSHAIFKPGDVITKINGKDCLSSEDFRIAEGATFTLFRLNDSGKFEKLTLTMPEKQPRTAVAELPLVQ